MSIFTRTVRSWMMIASAAVLVSAHTASAQELAEEATPIDPVAGLAKKFSISIDDLWYCYGFNEDTNTCSLYLGSRESCASLTPCFFPAEAEVKEQRTKEILAFPPSNDLHFCRGFNEVTNRCETYLGSEQSCASLTPCR